MLGKNLAVNYQEVFAMVLFGIGFANLLFSRNLIKKIIGMNIMDTSLYLLLACMGYINGGSAPITNESVSLYINPVPSSLVLTGIVVSVSVTSVMLALTIRLYRKYHTLDLDEIYIFSQKEEY